MILHVTQEAIDEAFNDINLRNPHSQCILATAATKQFCEPYECGINNLWSTVTDTRYSISKIGKRLIVEWCKARQGETYNKPTPCDVELTHF